MTQTADPAVATVPWRFFAAELEHVAPGRVSAVLIGLPDRDGGLTPRTRAGRAPQPTIDRFAVLDGPGEYAPPPDPPDEPAPENPEAAVEPEPKAKPVSAKAAIPKPRVYTSAAAKAEAEARVQAKAAAEAKSEE